MENATKTLVLRGNLWKKARKENTGVAWEPIQKNMENTCVAWEPMKTQGKLRFCIGTIENTTETHVLRGNLLKTSGKQTHGKHTFYV